MRRSARQASLALLRHHVEVLCDRHRIELRLLKASAALKARSNQFDRSITIAPVADYRTYAIALHEIGHVAAAGWRGFMLEEAAAWAWVREHALVWTSEMEWVAAYALSRCAAKVKRPRR